MPAFNRNIETILTRNTNASYMSLNQGQAFDYLQIINQFHKIGTWEYVVDKKHVFWSPETYEIHGLKPDVGPVDVERAIRFYQTDDAKRMGDLLAAAIKLKSGFQCKLRMVRSDGALCVTESNAAPVIDEHGQLTRIVGTFRDITSQTAHENVRLAHQELMRRIITTLPIGAALFDTQMRYVAWSPRWLSDHQLADGTDLKGKSHFELFPDIAQTVKHLYELALRGNVLGKENDRVERANGTVQILDWQMMPWIGRTGDVGGVLALVLTKYTGSPKIDNNHPPQTPAASLQALASLLVKN